MAKVLGNIYILYTHYNMYHIFNAVLYVIYSIYYVICVYICYIHIAPTYSRSIDIYSNMYSDYGIYI